MRSNTLIYLLAMTGANGLAQATEPAPASAALGATLAAPVEAQRVVTVREPVAQWSVKWMLVDPEQRKITVHVEPFGWQVVLEGQEYAAASTAIRPLLERALLPAIGAKISARAQAESQEEQP